MKIFKKKVVKLSHAEKVAQAQEKAQLALGMFTTAHNHLEEANEELSTVVAEATRQAQELQRQIEMANAEIGMNKAVQEKLKDFII